MSRLLNDLRYALRQIRKSPGFAATAILTLALGIGANAVIFTLVDSIMLRPLPFPHQARLMRIMSNANGDIYPKGWIQQLGSHSTAFQSISGYGANTEMNVSSDASVDREFGSPSQSTPSTRSGFIPCSALSFLGRMRSPVRIRKLSSVMDTGVSISAAIQLSSAKEFD